MERKPTATLAVIVSEGMVLLGRRPATAKLGAGKLNGPGGALIEGESLVNGIIRETREEFGIELDPSCCLKVGLLICIADSDDSLREVHIFRCTLFSGEPYAAEEIVPEWHPAHALPWDEMHEGDRHWFDQAISGQKFMATIRYRAPGEGLISYVPHER